MAEKLERLTLDTLHAGESVTLVAGEVPDAYTYVFTVQQPGEMPGCDITQISPDGTMIGPSPALLHGCGRWTTEKQNPMQRADWFVGRVYQEVAMTIGYGVLFVGGTIIISDPADNSTDRLRLEPACTEIILGKPTALPE